jgi:hypothetical protein
MSYYLAALVCLASLVANRAHAQIAIPGFTVNDVNFFGTLGGFAPAQPYVNALGLGGKEGQQRLLGYGFELSLDLGSDTTCARWSCGHAQELGLGYTHVGNLRSRVPGFDIRGSVRDWPTLTYYRTWSGANVGGRLPGGAFSPYLGLGTGYLVLSNLSFYDATGQIYTVTGDAIGASVSGGFVNEPGIFIQAAYRLRYFGGLGYKTPASPAKLPAELPRSLNLSGFEIAVGWQFHVKDR